jgi:phosphoribosylglycinamide formyltransferase-1
MHRYDAEAARYMIRIGILGSTRGSNLDAIVAAIHQKQLAADIAIVMSNKPDAGILAKAAGFGLKTLCIESSGKSREAFDREISLQLREHQVELVVLIGFMRILSAEFINDWHHRIINVHPSLLPKHAGKMDLDVHRAVLAANENESGCTVHVVTEIVDAGPIIIQEKCAVLTNDDEQTLKQRVQSLEGLALVKAINQFATKR